MAVLFETSYGDMVFDLLVEDCPNTCKNFLKLCKIKYFNHSLFFNVQKDLCVQAGDPTGTGRGGSSVYGVIYGDQARFFDDEIRPHLKHNRIGCLSMANGGKENANASQFFITTRPDTRDYFDEKNTLFGHLAEGEDILAKINDTYCDESGRPYQNIRIKHTIVLDDPFDDPKGLEVPERSPSPPRDAYGRLEDDEEVDPDDEGDMTEEQRKDLERKSDKRAAQVLEMVGDLPDADVAPPENALFVCQLNPATEDDDLELIFSRFGKILSCDIIRDWKTGESLNYGFVVFENEKDAERAYFKMDNVLIDDRRIKVDFSQSVANLWKNFRKNDPRSKEIAEARRRARGEAPRPVVDQRGGGKKYDMVFENDGYNNSGYGKKGRDRSPRRDNRVSRQSGDRSPRRDRDRDRGRDRSPPRKDRDRSPPRRDRDRSPRRDRERSPRREPRRDRDRSPRRDRDRSPPRRNRDRSPRRDRDRSPRRDRRDRRSRSRSPRR